MGERWSGGRARTGRQGWARQEEGCAWAHMHEAFPLVRAVFACRTSVLGCPVCPRDLHHASPPVSPPSGYRRALCGPSGTACSPLGPQEPPGGARLGALGRRRRRSRQPVAAAARATRQQHPLPCQQAARARLLRPSRPQRCAAAWFLPCVHSQAACCRLLPAASRPASPDLIAAAPAVARCSPGDACEERAVWRHHQAQQVTLGV